MNDSDSRPIHMVVDGPTERVIAAAPVLFAALKRLVALYQPEEVVDSDGDRYVEFEDFPGYEEGSAVWAEVLHALSLVGAQP